MIRPLLRRAALVLLALAMPAFAAPTAAVDAAAQRWRTSLDAFAEADRAHVPAPDGVVFVGSSSIRLWDGLESQFGGWSVVKRGVGGSTLSDCAALVPRLVLPYRPRLVVVYAGDNDLAEGATPQQLADRFGRFVDDVRAALPATRIAYVSIKPSPAREALLPAVQEANARIAALAAARDGVAFVDVYTAMLDADGRPRRELFRDDALHLNADGYALWRRLIVERLGNGDAITAAAPSAGGAAPSARAR